jgi:zinc protease
MNSKFLSIARLCTFMGLFLLASALNAQKIPLDSAIRTGKLENGLTYFIRHNEEPKNRAYMMIANNVGSILEDDDQQGLAHFMEHMNFNGTTNFPEKDLINILEKSGVKFGADLNAYTNYDETVYMLPMPLNDPTMLSTGLAVLRDWAREATLETEEIDKERGVILEEERMHRGLGERIQKQILPILTNHSRYSERTPIGKIDLLKTFKPEVIVRFRDDWYRPNLQAVIVVGDVDVDKTEAMIKAKFSDLKNPTPERERIDYEIPLQGKKQFAVIMDEEQPNVSIQILFKRRARKLEAEEDYKEIVKEILMNQMLAFRRYEKTSTDSNPDYLGLSIGKQDFMGGVEMFGFSVTSKEGRLKDAFASTWGLVERIKKNGFTEQGLNQAKTSLLQDYKQSLNEKEHTASESYANEYLKYFLEEEASPGIEWEVRFVESVLPSITVGEINELYRSYLEPHDRDIILLAQPDQKDELPDEAEIENWMKEIAGENMTGFSDSKSDKPLIESLPAAGKVVSKKEYKNLNVTELKLSNGIKVMLKPTSFKGSEISFVGFSEGGTSLYENDDYYNAENAAGFLSMMGIGDFSPTELQRKLTGKTAGASVGIGERMEVVQGGASTQDLETALKLVYLRFTDPRTDTLLFNNVINQSKEGIKNRHLNPQNVYSDTIRYVMGNYNYRYTPPSLKEIDALDLEKMESIYKERFADASDFILVFVGSLNVDSITPLLEKYLGALPVLNRREKARDLKITPPSGRIVKKVYAEKENKATVNIIAHGESKYSHLEALKLKALGEVLQMRLLEVLRESEGEVYTPGAAGSFQRGPKDEYSVMMSFVCSPKNADHLVSLAEKELVNIRENGVKNDELQKFKASYKKDLEQSLEDNGFWLNYLTRQCQYGGNLEEVNSYKSDLDKVTERSLLKASRKYFNLKNELVFELLPKEN